MTRPGATTLEEFERDPDPALDAELDARSRAVAPDDPATVVYTSGTTGPAKGVVLTHDMELRSAYGSAYTRAFEDGRRILFALPLHHVFAYVEGLLASLFVGGAVVCQPVFDPRGGARGDRAPRGRRGAVRADDVACGGRGRRGEGRTTCRACTR